MVSERRIGRLVTLSVVALVWCTPVYILISASFHSTADIIARNPLVLLWPFGTLANYRQVSADGVLFDAVWNSLAIATVGTITCTAVALPAAYWSAISESTTTLKGFFGWLLSTRMVPPAAVLIPVFVLAETMRMTRSTVGLGIIVATAQVPLAAWLFRQVMREVPRSLTDALLLDGGSDASVLRYVLLPLAWPSLATAILLVFVFSWNDYLFASVLISDPALKTLPLLTADFVTGYQISWGPMLACGAAMLLPPIIVAALIRGSFVGSIVKK